MNTPGAGFSFGSFLDVTLFYYRIIMSQKFHMIILSSEKPRFEEKSHLLCIYKPTLM